MPLVTTTDKNVNEIAVEIGNGQIQVQYADYHYFTSTTGASIPTYTFIPAGLSESYSYPQNINCKGQWNDAGFEANLIVKKTLLNTTSLFNRFLGYIPANGFTVMMYDFLLQVTFKTGFGISSDKTYLFSIHRGFSRHQRVTTWIGDSPSGNTTVGVYDITFRFGIKYNFQPLRTDNIYSDSKFTLIDDNTQPATKYLDVYESITGPVVSSLEILSNTNRPITNGSFSADTVAGERVNGSKVSYTFATTDKIDRASYTLKLYVKTVGLDNRFYSNGSSGTYTGYCYDRRISLTNQYRDNGRSFDGSFIANNANFIIQNRIGLQCGYVRSSITNNTNTKSVSSSSDATPATTSTSGTASAIISRYVISGIYSSGYTELANSTNNDGLHLSFPKRVRFNSLLKNYDRAHDTTNDRVYYGIRCPLSTQLKNSNTDHIPVQFGTNTIPTRFGTSNILKFTNFNSKSSSYQKTRILAAYSAAFSQQIYTYSDVLDYKYGVKQLLKLDLDAKREGLINGTTLNTRDNVEDAPVLLRGEMKPAYIHKKRDVLDLSSITVVGGYSIKPDNSLQGINLNGYRYIFFRPTQASGTSASGVKKFRITIWESAGDQVAEKYWEDVISFSTQNPIPNAIIDLMFPNYPGKVIDTQDDPYPRAGASLSAQERANSPYYGCGRVIRIDISTPGDFDTTNFVCQAITRQFPTPQNSNDYLNFIPSNGKDTNLKVLEVPNTSTKYGRRFLLMRQSEKPEEETDLIVTTQSNTTTLKRLSVGEFVTRLNTLHGGMICTVVDGNAVATNMQGVHWNFSVNNSAQIFDQTALNINYAPNVFTDKKGTIYHSEIFQGMYLDFPPFMQDLFKYESFDNWLVSNKRRPNSDTYDFDMKIYCNIRGYLYGSQAVIAATLTTPTKNARAVSKVGDVTLFQYTPVPTVDKGTTLNNNGTYSLGFYTTGRPYGYRNYDYGTSSFNRARITSTSNLAIFNATYTPNIVNVKMLPAKITRIAYGSVIAYVENPYAKIASNFNIVNVSEGKIKNEVSVVLGKSIYELSPYLNPTVSGTQKTQALASQRIANLNSFTLELYDLKVNNTSTLGSKPIGFLPSILNQNTAFNPQFLLLSEVYNFGDTQSLVMSNSDFSDENNWFYYNDPIYAMANVFKLTENNVYAISPNANYLYSLGTYQNYLVLQTTTRDLIKSIGGVGQYGRLPPDPRYSLLIDGNNTSVNLSSIFTTLIPPITGQYSGSVKKYSALICVDYDDLVVFYNVDTIYNTIFYKYVNYELMNARTALISSSVFCVNPATSLSNISTIYDRETNKVRMVFMTSLLVAGSYVNNIFYTEFDYKNGFMDIPNEFHHIAGKYNASDYIPSNIYYNQTLSNNLDLPYQKVGIVQYNNNDQKGRIGIFYVNKNGALFNTNIVPFTFTEEIREIK
jgi:hypothetical protein